MTKLRNEERGDVTYTIMNEVAPSFKSILINHTIVVPLVKYEESFTIFTFKMGPLKLSELDRDWNRFKELNMEPLYRMPVIIINSRYAQ